MSNARTILVTMTAILALSACAKKRIEIPPEPIGTRTTPPATQTVSADPSRPTPGSQADFVASISADRIFFDTDKFDVDAEDQDVLRSQAEWLAKYPAKRVSIEGHADERGTRDYNLALGERRANAAKNFLASLGIDPARISTISYGKERPDALGSDEASWARNRRAVTVTVE
jgi:peptidoglycan-associated lipoprotein